MASEPNINAQAAFLTAVKLRSLDTAVEVLKGIHDGKEAVRRAAGNLDDDASFLNGIRGGQKRGSVVTSLLPKLDDLRRAGDLFFDVARLHVQTVDALLGMRARHMGRLEERVGDLLGFPVRGNRGETLTMVVPVRAVEADYAERPKDGDRTSHCEITRQFRVKNLTRDAWPVDSVKEVEPVPMTWSPPFPGAEPPLGVEVRRDRAEVKKGEVAPLRLRIFWSKGTLDRINPSAEVRGEYLLPGSNGEVAKVIRLVLRFDLND